MSTIFHTNKDLCQQSSIIGKYFAKLSDDFFLEKAVPKKQWYAGIRKRIGWIGALIGRTTWPARGTSLWAGWRTTSTTTRWRLRWRSTSSFDLDQVAFEDEEELGKATVARALAVLRFYIKNPKMSDNASIIGISLLWAMWTRENWGWLETVSEDTLHQGELQLITLFLPFLHQGDFN